MDGLEFIYAICMTSCAICMLYACYVHAICMHNTFNMHHIYKCSAQIILNMHSVDLPVCA